MKNFEKYKTAEDRDHTFDQFCERQESCAHCALNSSKTASLTSCAFAWLDLEAEEEKPMACPYCGGDAIVVNNEENGFWHVSCGICFSASKEYADKSAAIERYNSICRAVKAAKEGDMTHEKL